MQRSSAGPGLAVCRADDALPEWLINRLLLGTSRCELYRVSNLCLPPALPSLCVHHRLPGGLLAGLLVAMDTANFPHPPCPPTVGFLEACCLACRW